MKIKITSKIGNNGKSILDYEVDSDDISECTYIGSNMYVDLPDGLTPVLYDKKLNSWRVPEINEEWYNYDKQEWANAVVLGKGKTKKPGDTVAVDGTEALMMLVYIPRYEYKIEGDFGKGGQSAALPGEIEVKFINTNQTKSDDSYIMHPAFTFGDEDLHGIWVGKFELSHITKSQGNQSIEEVGTDEILNCTDVNCSEAQYLRTLPNKASLRYNNVSNFWYGIKSIENTQSFGLSNIDIHMVKNSEWGDVAYLSQSKYGKYGNADYENKYKEVYQNKSDNYITGSSNGTPCQSDSRSEGQCSYDNMQDLGEDSNGYKMGQCGPGASTTGNIYGVYDMSGGAWEYVMGAYGDSQGIYSGSSSSSNSGFNGRTGNDNGNVTNGVDLPNSKYYDVYKTNNAETACDNEKPCLGHALLEIKNNTSDRGWYGDYGAMANLRYPWFVRGGAFSGLYAGIFEYDYTNGDIQKHVSSRFVGFGK